LLLGLIGRNSTSQAPSKHSAQRPVDDILYAFKDFIPYTLSMLRAVLRLSTHYYEILLAIAFVHDLGLVL
jgi:hypothetical protein